MTDHQSPHTSSDARSAQTGRRQRLTALAQQARREISLTAHPTLEWMPAVQDPEGGRALDVLIVGAGQGGTTLAFQLARDRVPEVLVIDKAGPGREGPWQTYARMPTLRSPKEYTGPDLGVPSLTYQAWHEAMFGSDTWSQFALIKTRDWADYLLWVREQTGVRIESNTELRSVTAAEHSGRRLVRAVLGTPDGERTVYCRRLVLATGQDGTGRWMMPDFVEALPQHVRAHAADDIDFNQLGGRTVAVLGAGASAADNAAEALEHGARAVHMFVRREKMQRIQPYRWITFRGFLRHLCDLDDAWRWRFMQRVLSMRESIPQDTYDRMRRWSNFEIHTGAGWHDARMVDAGEAGRVRIETTRGPFDADFVIAGTGIDIDFSCRPELAGFADQILTWADAYTPPAEEVDERLARYPYLSADGTYMEKHPGQAPLLARIYDFTIAATMSFGPSGASINALNTAVPRLGASITKSLFREDVEHHWNDFLDYDVPVFMPSAVDHAK